MQILRLNKDNYHEYISNIFSLLEETILLDYFDNEIDRGYIDNRFNSLNQYLEDESAIVFIAVENGHFLGWAWTYKIERPIGKRLHIGEFAVDGNYRGKGIGKALLEEVNKYAAKYGYNALDLMVSVSNISATNFYKNNGFETERLLMRKKVDNHEE